MDRFLQKFQKHRRYMAWFSLFGLFFLVYASYKGVNDSVISSMSLAFTGVIMAYMGSISLEKFKSKSDDE